MCDDGILIILSGPSGSGKGTVVKELVKDEDYALSISATTRKPRNYEKEGVHYFFHSKEEFEKMQENGELLEWASFCGNYYGTPKKYVENHLKEGNNVILEIEVQGALKVKALYPECVLVFMLPPSFEELRRRLHGRNTEDEEAINKRTQRALEEIKIASGYDYVVVNDSVEQACDDIRTLVRAERMRCRRNKKVIENFKGEI